MNNPKLEGIVNRFAESKKIEGEFWEKYQAFANYLILKETYFSINEEYPYESILDNDLIEGINFGKNSTMGVDGCFFIYKKEILHLNIDDDEILEKFKNFTDGILNIILIQTKSGKLEPTDLSTLSNCFLTEFTGQEEWEKFVAFREKCKSLIQSNDKINFQFSCIYVTGNETDSNLFSNSTFTVREDALKKTMKDFLWIRRDENISLTYKSDNEILDIWEEQEQNSVTINRTVQYVEITKEIQIPNVGKILFGAISFGELMKIIYDKEKQKPNDLYGYNVRAEIEKSDIKPRIIKTIKENGERFILLNNGVTLIVDKQETRGAKGIVLENIRIVNGCQTCHAILETCKETNAYDNLQVNIKIIETEKDENLLGDITYSSNNQNPVTKENLISIHPKMFELEKSYKDFDLSKKISIDSPLFERRQGQYKNTSTKFVDMLAQSKAFISLWKKEPHKAAMYRDEVLDDYTKLRDTDTNFINKSLVSGILWFNIYSKIPSIYENARYQIYSTIVLYALERHLNESDILSITDLRDISLNIDSSWLENLKLNFKDEVEIAIDAIKTASDPGGNLLFPPSNKKGGIHYRKFYPPSALIVIYNKYKEIKNAAKTTTNSAS
jgi:hypothetical protein